MAEPSAAGPKAGAEKADDKDKEKPKQGIESREIHTYVAPWPIYSLASSNRSGAEHTYRFAVGSFVEEYANKIQVVQCDEETGNFIIRGVADHPYPATKLLWAPKPLCNEKDLFASTGDYLRLWEVHDEHVSLHCLLDPHRQSEFCAPLTSFDWCLDDPNTIATCSVDTTVAIWDVENQKPSTMMVAHDKDAYDITFSTNRNIFCSVGGEGSMRLFDLRSLKHSTIMYETPDSKPLLRVTWNRLNVHYIAFAKMDSPETVILDIRKPSEPVSTLRSHSACVNSVAWAPHSSDHMCTGADDTQALIWDVSGLPGPVQDPILAYWADAEINSLIWPREHPDWVVISLQDKMQMLRV